MYLFCGIARLLLKDLEFNSRPHEPLDLTPGKGSEAALFLCGTCFGCLVIDTGLVVVER